jgi:hypothetical protein
MREAIRSVGVFLLFAVAVLLWGQAALTNEDLVKLSKAGLSEDFILTLIQQQPSGLQTDARRLAELKSSGVSERVILAAVRKTPPQEPLTTSGMLELVKAGFSENFLLDILNAQPVRIATDAANIVQLKQAGLSERVLAQIVTKSAGREIPKGAEIVVRLIDSIDSEKAAPGDTFRASLDEALQVGTEVIAPKGADAVVRLAAEKESGRLTGRAELTVELASVTIDGKPVPIRTASVTQASGSRGERTAKVAAGTAAVGAIIGAIAGGGKGAAIGAGAGAAAGAGSQVFMKGQRVFIPSETVLVFLTETPVKIP